MPHPDLLNPNIMVRDEDHRGVVIDSPYAKRDLCKQAALFPGSVSLVGHSFGYDLLKTAYAASLRKEFAFASKKSFLRKVSY